MTFGEIEYSDWTEMWERRWGGGVKSQNGVKVHNVTAPPPQTPISLCKYTHSDPHPDQH